MTHDPIRAALAAAAKRLCVCDGECFETRHGRMNGPCDAMIGQAAAAIAAFLRALPACDVMMAQNPDPHAADPGGPHSTITLAAAVERAARDGGHE